MFSTFDDTDYQQVVEDDLGHPRCWNSVRHHFRTSRTKKPPFGDLDVLLAWVIL